MKFAVSVVLVSAALLAHQDQKPKIQSGVELVTIDLQVVDKTGAPVRDLASADFEVWIDNKKRPISRSELIAYDGSAAPAATDSITRPADPLISSSGAARRMYVVAVDEHSLRVGTARAAMEAAGRFIDGLRPEDLVSLHAYPTGIIQTDLTTDHASIKAQLVKIRGLWAPRIADQYKLSLAEVVDIASDDGKTIERVEMRECGRSNALCRIGLLGQARALAEMLEMRIDQSLGGLRGLIHALRPIPGRKTVVLVSGGLFASDRAFGRVDVSSRMLEIGRAAAEANVSLYTLHMDSTFLDAFSADGVVTPTMFRDMNMMKIGLELVSGAAGGEVFRVETGNADRVFDRVLQETSAHYLLGVEVGDGDRDGKTHTIRVRVARRGLTVRHRNLVVIPRAAGTR